VNLVGVLFKETRSNMASITNTQAGIFTRIPSKITRNWSTRVVHAFTGKDAQVPGRNHQNSIVNAVTLTVEYNPHLLDVPTEFTDADDDGNTQLDLWQEARKDWAALENAITVVVNDFAKRAANRVEKGQMATMDILGKTTTKYSMDDNEVAERDCDKPNDVNRSGAEVETIIDESPPLRRVDYSNSTVLAADSASQYNSTDIDKLARRIARMHSNQRPHKDSTLAKFGRSLHERRRQ